MGTISYAQYQEGKNTLGLLVGIGGGDLKGTDATPVAVEYNFYNFHPKVQFGVMAAWASTSEEFNYGWGVGKWSYTYIILAAQANYHFMPNEKFDPFAGLSLGYNIGSSTWEWKTGSGGSPASATVGGFFWSAQAGCNYWFSPQWAAQVRVGYFPYVGAGISYALK
jgi:outer membrane protein W